MGRSEVPSLFKAALFLTKSILDLHIFMYGSYRTLHKFPLFKQTMAIFKTNSFL